MTKKLNETDEERSRRLAKDRERKRRARSAETPEQTIARRKRNAETTAKSRSAETPEQASARRKRNAEATAKLRLAETSEQTSARRGKNKETTARSRSTETADQTSTRRKRNIETMPVVHRYEAGLVKEAQSEQFKVISIKQNSRSNRARGKKQLSIHTSQLEHSLTLQQYGENLVGFSVPGRTCTPPPVDHSICSDASDNEAIDSLEIKDIGSCAPLELVTQISSGRIAKKEVQDLANEKSPVTNEQFFSTNQISGLEYNAKQVPESPVSWKSEVAKTNTDDGKIVMTAEAIKQFVFLQDISPPSMRETELLIAFTHMNFELHSTLLYLEQKMPSHYRRPLLQPLEQNCVAQAFPCAHKVVLQYTLQSVNYNIPAALQKLANSGIKSSSTSAGIPIKPIVIQPMPDNG